MRWLTRYRTSRLLNINANIVLADLVSTAVTALVMDAVHTRLASRLGVVVWTTIIDGAISLAIFAGLHRYTNAARGVGDLVRVQMHRWVLSPLHYVVGASLQYALLAAGVRVGVTVLVAYISALVFVRAVHTHYGKRSGLFQ
jgi:hypothetical protein